MSIVRRTAQTTWAGPPAGGSGKLAAGSGALTDLNVTRSTRTERPGGLTSPAELAGAAPLLEPN